MKYKTELLLLLTSVAMFVISGLCYSYATGSGSITFALSLSYPYRDYALLFIGAGTVLMGIASLSYSKKNKAISNQKLRF